MDLNGIMIQIQFVVKGIAQMSFIPMAYLMRQMLVNVFVKMGGIGIQLNLIALS
jgi:hypothetical protein